MTPSGFVPDNQWIYIWLRHAIDLGLVLGVFVMISHFMGERRTLWMVRGLAIIMITALVSEKLGLVLLNFVLEKLVLGSAVAIAVIFQSDLRRFLEQLGSGDFGQIFQPKRAVPRTDSVIDEIVDAVRELSQNRTGALMVLEANGALDERVFVNPGVNLNAEVSKELLLTIFQTTTILHDGAVFISGPRIVSAGVIFPLSEKTAPRQWGTRHRAALGLTERVDNCLCIVVSEETGSISLAEKGFLNRPLTSTKLKELLEERFQRGVDRETGTPTLSRLSRKIGGRSLTLLQSLIRLLLLPFKQKK
jgi:uncharacterized protein (TIGR00159 family)